MYERQRESERDRQRKCMPVSVREWGRLLIRVWVRVC